MSKKIKVVWICHVQNPMLREKIPVGVSKIEHVVRKIIQKPEITFCPDVAQWITNGAKEMESFQDEVELYIVSPGYALKDEYFEFMEKGVYYCLYRNEDYEFWKILKNKLFHTQYKTLYKKNRRRIMHYINEIKPDIIHLIGLENHFYALSLQDVPTGIPTIAQLTALLNDPDFFTHFFMTEEEYNYRADIERRILLRANYIGTCAKKFTDIIYGFIKPDAVILNLSLPLTEEMNQSETKKEYDFVYFAVNISKAIDLALEAFIIASKSNPGITLDVIGGCPDNLRSLLDEKLVNSGLTSNVIFEGKLPTHDDVLRQIKKSRFALLPLKIDLTSGTIREAMANGLPVLTTDTGVNGTQKLNVNAETVMITPIGDSEALANNMELLLKNPDLAEKLRVNAFELHSRRKSNKEVVRHYIDVYNACIENFHGGKQMPESFLTK